MVRWVILELVETCTRESSDSTWMANVFHRCMVSVVGVEAIYRENLTKKLSLLPVPAHESTRHKVTGSWFNLTTAYYLRSTRVKQYPIIDEVLALSTSISSEKKVYSVRPQKNAIMRSISVKLTQF